MTDARTRLDQVDARTNAATTGPWSRDRTYPFGNAGPYLISVRSPQVTISDGLAKGDAEFIAHARTDLPAATTALRAVLNLHQEDLYRGHPHLSNGCKTCGGDYPCPTVTAITTALEEA